MNKKKEIWIAGFALFSLFFGAGNLILPPTLGVKSGLDWWIVVIGFVLTAVTIPILAIFAHAKLQGTLYDFGKKVSPFFSTVYCLLIYTIAIAIPSPRTASVTHEMAIHPFFGTSSLLTSSIYFLLVFIFAVNRSKIISLIGKFLTPIIVLILLVIIVIAIFTSSGIVNPSTFTTPFVDGILEGYQTFDAIGGVVVGAVIIISLNLRGHTSFEAKKELITKAGFIAGTGLFLVYGGLILSGSLFSATFAENATRIEVLSGLGTKTLGNFGAAFLSISVALACFTTAVGIVTGTADYIKGIFKGSKTAYIATAAIASVIGIIVGSYQVDFIITLAVPALMFLYPITIVLILLNIVPNKYGTKLVFRGVVLVTFIFSITDFLGFIIPRENLTGIKSIIPLAEFSLGWVIPAFLVFAGLNLIQKK
ncbi:MULTISPECIES: branched-chain amino acid transport system II carrier protein [unclassified Polaribacter]|uniref:branched-chain amino acid transport system II carrier protein n=1 Tax=unclassified Polaribacter TaxID=196858 RepID=UPI00052D66B2|nr:MULTISPECIES: branched-chain amino acid transport system II carrier protein [unclassified Polaribacter]KGL60066.1 branched-chain amino acid transport system carrier protein [Polaribacter sp. Hel1_33_49]MBT3741016.1 branched-chain amino acid transport system II carrier protein [Polaribacter sp.]MDG1194792.1 branched-chain amino acid transport system II carrier protein [Polaribacter sp.]MDG1403984.1 branched-chain amino acid transport system II carrier protein [Polaribacter sp.]PKV66078.1 LIV